VCQRLINYIDDNELINQLLATLEVGHKVYTAAKAHSFEIWLQINMAETAFLFGVLGI
jgi:hypothetical protein